MTSYADGSIAQTGINATPPVDAVVPANVVAGQKLLAIVVQQSVASTTGVISPVVAGSWTPRPDGSGHAGTTNPIDIATFTRTATSADAASTTAVPVVHQFTGTNVQGRMVAVIVGYGEVDDSQPIMAAAFSSVGGSTARATASITTSGPARLVVAAADRNASNYTAGTSGLTELLDLADSIAPTLPSNTSLAVFDSGTDLPAGTYTRTVTASTSTSTTAQVIIALRPAVAAPPNNTAPTVSVAPATISAAEPGETYSVTATVADSDGTIASTSFTSSTLTLTGSGLSRSFQIPLSQNAVTHMVTVTTTDNAGATSFATVTVNALACEEAIYDGTQLVPYVEYVMS